MVGLQLPSKNPPALRGVWVLGVAPQPIPPRFIRLHRGVALMGGARLRPEILGFESGGPPGPPRLNKSRISGLNFCPLAHGIESPGEDLLIRKPVAQPTCKGNAVAPLDEGDGSRHPADGGRKLKISPADRSKTTRACSQHLWGRRGPTSEPHVHKGPRDLGSTCRPQA